MINNIYINAKLISDFKLCMEHLKSHDLWSFGNIWKKNANIFNTLMDDYHSKDSDSASRLRAAALLVERKLNDPAAAADLFEIEIIPLLYKYMALFSPIDAYEGKWHIFSSKSGFLTISNTEVPINLHSGVDPLHEARILASKLYKEGYLNISIMGMGLGFLPYALWEKSHGAANISIYEPNPIMIDFAINYGILSWIDQDKLSVFSSDNFAELIDAYKENTNKNNSLGYISDYCLYEDIGDYKTFLYDSIENSHCLLRFDDYYKVNYNHNALKFAGYASDYLKTINTQDCIVVAAGPSLSDYYDWLREQKGKKLIIAVTTVVKKLLAEKIIPDVVVIADPNENTYPHLESIAEQTKDITLIAESVSYWKSISIWKGPIYKVLSCNYHKTIEEMFKSKQEPWIIGGTVSSLALELAIRLKAPNIYLVGLDLAYPGNKFYADGAIGRKDNNIQSNLMVPSVDGSMVPTIEIFNLFRQNIEKQIQANPSSKYINCSKNGALIKGTIPFK